MVHSHVLSWYAVYYKATFLLLVAATTAAAAVSAAAAAFLMAAPQGADSQSYHKGYNRNSNDISYNRRHKLLSFLIVRNYFLDAAFTEVR